MSAKLKTLKMECRRGEDFEKILERVKPLIVPYETRQQGRISFYHQKKCFGFIDKTYFFHGSWVKSEQIKPGDRVTYTPATSPGGKQQARSIEPL